MLCSVVLFGSAHFDEVSGSCNKGSKCKLSLSYAGSSHYVTFTVDSSVAGKSWDVVMKRNNKSIYKAVKKTDSNGNFSQKKAASGSTVGKIYGYAKNKSTGEVCTATATWHN